MGPTVLSNPFLLLSLLESLKLALKIKHPILEFQSSLSIYEGQKNSDYYKYYIVWWNCDPPPFPILPWTLLYGLNNSICSKLSIFYELVV